jgi:hypothetical protein
MTDRTPPPAPSLRSACQEALDFLRQRVPKGDGTDEALADRLGLIGGAYTAARLAQALARADATDSPMSRASLDEVKSVAAELLDAGEAMIAALAAHGPFPQLTLEVCQLTEAILRARHCRA